MRRKALSILTNNFQINEEIVLLLVKGIGFKDGGIKDICFRKLISLPEELQTIAAKEISNYITTDDLDILSIASEILIQLNGYSVSFLKNYLSNSNPDVRKFACDIIGAIASKSNIDIIQPETLEIENNKKIDDYIVNKITELLHDADLNVRASAIETLGNLKNIQSIIVLINYYNSNQELDKIFPSGKALIIEAIGKIASIDSLNNEKNLYNKIQLAEEFILSTLEKEDDIFLKIACIDSLGLCSRKFETYNKLLNIMSEENIMPNIDILNIDTIHPEVGFQCMILKNLYLISKRIGCEFKISDALRYVAHFALTDYNEDLKIAGLASLGNIYEPSDLPFIMKILSETIRTEDRGDINVTKKYSVTISKNKSEPIDELILKNIIVHSNIPTFNEFIKLMFSSEYNLYNGNIELLSKISLFWNTLNEERKKLIFKTVLDNCHSAENINFADIKELLDKIDSNLLNQILNRDIN